jgi:hypothetical protein
MKRRCFLFTAFSFITFLGFGQNDSLQLKDKIERKDNVQSTSKIKVKDSLSLVPTNRPKKAFLWGAIIPAGGQVYNKRWWKIPLAAGAYVGLGLYIKNRQDLFNRYDQIYDSATSCKCNQEISPGFNWSAKQIKVVRDKARDSRDVSLFLSIGAHLIIALEAYVDAHLKDFNVSEDLSFKINPATGSIGFVYQLH